MQMRYCKRMTTALDLVRVRRMAATGVARQIRMEAGLSQAEIADAVGVHRVTLFKWENGRQRPKGPRALRYGEVLDELAAR